ncbi:transcriptional regulator, TetR family [Methylocella silvestris BL2]|uniref:Transcriptional regulator, TetR family n=1 Tax=Methylocella silvestris (strain DSM 15510 / CIP 108128 / LMG 27833 / NCIMB 13906 / BL2) TaxID=395965 RepID=B8EQK6_METSB|nr:transcriptional regulator, TetR family [Methylocella silvestris BL2]
MSVDPKGPGPRISKEKRAPAAGSPRKPRADAKRNHERLVEMAKAAFADVGVDVGLDEIARRAGVGIGTLYRHFPNRDAIVEAVYRREVQQLADSAASLLQSLSPGEALREWMRLFVDYIATKKVIAPALGSIVGGASELYASSGARITAAMSLLVERAGASGDIRADVDPNDLLRALVGFTYGNAAPGWEASARRLIDILMDGLRPPRT